MRYLNYFTAVFAVFFLACSGKSDKRDLHEYYFPVENLREGLVYEYDLAQGDSSAPEYWYFKSFRRDSGMFLSGTYYDRFFQIGQIVREKIVPSGVLAREYLLYEPDMTTGELRETTAKIEAPNVFPFAVKDSSGVFLFSLKFHPAADSTATLYVIRNRRFLGDAPDFEFQGKTYPCVRFGLREVIGNEKEGAAEVEGRGEEWYAKGLGKVYYRKSYGSSDQAAFEYKLKDIFPMSELEQRAAAMDAGQSSL